MVKICQEKNYWNHGLWVQIKRILGLTLKLEDRENLHWKEPVLGLSDIYVLIWPLVGTSTYVGTFSFSSKAS